MTTNQVYLIFAIKYRLIFNYPLQLPIILLRIKQESKSTYGEILTALLLQMINPEQEGRS